MNTRQLVRPRLTTLWGGSGIVVASLLSVLAFFHFAIPLTDEYSLVFSAPIPHLVSSIIFLVAVGVLAFGIHGESGIVADSVVGRIALMVFGLGDLVLELVALLSNNLSPRALVVEGYFTFSIEVIVLVSVAVAAIVVVRADVLRGFGRLALVVVAVCEAITIGVWFIPALVETYLAAWAELLSPASLIVLGFAYLLQGRSAAIHHRLQVINENW